MNCVAPITLFALMAAPGAVWADDAAAPLSDKPKVVVTAHARPPGGEISLTKLPVQLRDVAQSVTVLDRTLLQAQGATSLADALHNVPGITLGGAEGGQIGNNINLNGFSARTDVFLDGFRDRGQYYRDIFALQQVEVLQGPSSMLFGRGSTGGAINQVTKKPTLNPATELVLSGSTTGLARGTADVNAPISDTAAFRLSVMGQQGAPTTRNKTTVQDFGAAPSVRFGIGTPTEVTVSALVQHNNDRPDYGLPPLNGHPANVSRNTVYGATDDRTVQDIVAVGGQIRHKLSDAVTLRDQIQYNQVDTNARETAPNTIGTVNGSGFHALSPSAVSNLPLDQLSVRLQSHDRKIHDTSLYNQAEVLANFDTGPFHHALIAGFELGRDEYHNQNYYRLGTCNGVPLNAPGTIAGYVSCVPLVNPPYVHSPANAPSQAGNLATGTADAEAVYFNDTLSVLKTLKLVGGVRYDNYAATITNSINSSNTAGNTTLARAKQTVGFTSVRAGIIWQPTEDQSYYASYSTSFNPSLEQLTSTTGISQPLPPETNTAYEVGAKWEAFNDHLAIDAAAFQITKDNARSQNSNGTYDATGDIRVNGARASVTGKITSAWQVYAAYTYLDAEIIKAIAVGTQGKIPGNTANHSASLWSTYTFDRTWEVGGGMVYVGDRYANNTDTVKVGGYVRWDATVAYHQPRYDIRLNLFNLFDTKYYDALVQSDGGRSVPGTGRSAMLTLVYRP